MTWEQEKGRMQAEGMRIWAEDVGCKTPTEFLKYLDDHKNDKPLYMTLDEMKLQQMKIVTDYSKDTHIQRMARILMDIEQNGESAICISSLTPNDKKQLSESGYTTKEVQFSDASLHTIHKS